MNKFKAIQSILSSTIMVLDGAMGTMIQPYKFAEEDYRGTSFKNWHKDLKGNNDILSITQPEVIQNIHKAYIDAGADIIETNTFNSQRISLADYDMQEYVTEVNLASAKVARAAADAATRKVWVAGAVGPMNRTLSLSPNVNDPSFRAMTFDEAMSAYKEQILALIKGGVDIILIETIFDTLNAKAAISAAKKIFREDSSLELPLMLSGTIVDQAGRTLSGQTPHAFLISVLHAQPLSVGLNCALGASLMTPYLQEIAKHSPTAISAYPNAGLPNEMGDYDQSPSTLATQVEEWLNQRIINIIGGCCGTTPDHIAALKEIAMQYNPRPIV